MELSSSPLVAVRMTSRLAVDACTLVAGRLTLQLAVDARMLVVVVVERKDEVAAAVPDTVGSPEAAVAVFAVE